MSIQELCRMFGKSRQAYYAAQCRRDRKRVDEELVIHHILERRKMQPKEGTRKLYHNLKPIFKVEGVKIGRDKLFDLIRRNNLLVKKKKRSKRTTNSDHPFYKYPNLIKNKVVDRSETVWVCDITYLPFKSSFAYLSLVTDLYSHKIVGYCLHHDLKTEGALKAIKAALKQRQYPERKLIHHSDKGIQYCCHRYTKTLKSWGVEISMAEAGNPYENAVAERINGILKNEFSLDYARWISIKDLKKAVDDAVWIYNHIRSHASCDYKTPIETHHLKGYIKKRWGRKSLQQV